MCARKSANVLSTHTAIIMGMGNGEATRSWRRRGSGLRVAGAAAGAAVAAPELATLSYGVKGVRLELEGVVCIVHLRRTHKRELLL